jgi:hypothetical protein
MRQKLLIATTLALGTGITGGANQTEATQGSGVVIVTGESGASITVTFTRGSSTVTKTLTGTGSSQYVVLSSADVAGLGDGSIGVSATQTDAAGNASSAGTTSFTLDTSAPAVPTLAGSNTVTLGPAEVAPMIDMQQLPVNAGPPNSACHASGIGVIGPPSARGGAAAPLNA